jgi:hypothetical protein
MDKRKNLKIYTKPSLKVHGDLKDITKAGQSGSGDFAHRYGTHS